MNTPGRRSFIHNMPGSWTKDTRVVVAMVLLLLTLQLMLLTASVSGLCLVVNGECRVDDNKPVHVAVGRIANQIGCQEKCYENTRCLWWTWYERSSPIRPGECLLFNCDCRFDTNTSTTCEYCFTGSRHCFEDFGGVKNQNAVAVVGGLEHAQHVEVLKNDTNCGHDLICDLPDGRAPWGLSSATVGQKLYACGGITGDNTSVSNTCLVYDLFKPGWSDARTPPMSLPKAHSASLDAYGELYVIGGLIHNTDNNPILAANSIEAFNYESGSWRLVTTIPGGGRWGHCAARAKELVYVLGGIGEKGETLNTDNAFLVFNTTSLQWKRLPKPMRFRRFHDCVMVSDGLLVAGGIDESEQTLAEVELFNVTNAMWSNRGKLNEARSGLGLALVDEGRVVLAIGGRSSTGHRLASVEKYHLLRDAWTLSDDLELEEARSHFSVTNVPINLIPQHCS